MKKIAIINNKGGVSKTASSVALANIMAKDYGKRVLLVDMDPQKNTTSRFTEVNFYEIFEALMKNPNGVIANKEPSVEDVLLNPCIDLHTVIKRTPYENIDLLPAELTLSNAEEKLRTEYVNGPIQTRLKTALKQVEDEYDYAIIDCGPSVALLNVNALCAAEEVYIPLRSDGDSLIGVAITRNLVEQIAKWNGELEIGGVFFTCFNKRERMGREMFLYLDAFLKDYDFPLLPITISNSTIVKQASVTKLSLDEIDEDATVSKQYKQLCGYIVAPNRTLYLEKLMKELK